MKQQDMAELLRSVPLEQLQAVVAERRVRTLEEYRIQLQLAVKQVDMELAALQNPTPGLVVKVHGEVPQMWHKLGISKAGLVTPHTAPHRDSGEAPPLESLLGPRRPRLLVGDPEDSGKSDTVHHVNRPGNPRTQAQRMYRSLQTHCWRNKVTRRSLRHSNQVTYRRTLKWLRQRWNASPADCAAVLDKYIALGD